MDCAPCGFLLFMQLLVIAIVFATKTISYVPRYCWDGKEEKSRTHLSVHTMTQLAGSSLGKSIAPSGSSSRLIQMFCSLARYQDCTYGLLVQARLEWQNLRVEQRTRRTWYEITISTLSHLLFVSVWTIISSFGDWVQQGRASASYYTIVVVDKHGY